MHTVNKGTNSERIVYNADEMDAMLDFELLLSRGKARAEASKVVRQTYTGISPIFWSRLGATVK